MSDGCKCSTFIESQKKDESYRCRSGYPCIYLSCGWKMLEISQELLTDTIGCPELLSRLSSPPDSYQLLIPSVNQTWRAEKPAHMLPWFSEKIAIKRRSLLVSKCFFSQKSHFLVDFHGVSSPFIYHRSMDSPVDFHGFRAAPGWCSPPPWRVAPYPPRRPKRDTVSLWCVWRSWSRIVMVI